MNKEGKRIRNLESAALKTTIFAILAFIGSVAGGFKLYKLIMDSLDGEMTDVFSFLKPLNLFGFEINTAQLSLVVGGLLFLIPFWLLISFLIKRHGLVNDEIVGTGLYWFLLLIFIAGILYFLGILPKLFEGKFNELTKINKDWKSLAGAGASLLGFILSLWTIINISAADRAPVEYTEEDDYDDYDDYDDDEYEDDDDYYEEPLRPTKKQSRRKHRVVEEVYEDEYEDDEYEDEEYDVEDEYEEEIVDRKSPKKYGYDDEPVKPVKKSRRQPVESADDDFEVVQAVNLEPVKPEKEIIEESNLTDNSNLENTMVYNAPFEKTQEIPVTPVAPLATEDSITPMEVVNNDVQKEEEISETPEAAPYSVEEAKPIEKDPHEEPFQSPYTNATPIDFPEQENNIEEAGDFEEEEITIKRRYIQMPDEDKVIVVTREFDSKGKLLKESTEIKNKSELN